MRFISKYRAYSLVVQRTKSPEWAFAHGVKAQPGIVADFQQAGRGLSPWEIDEAARVFDFTGVSAGEDPINRLSFFDTELHGDAYGWDKATREKAEKRLMSGESFGTDYIVVERPKLVAPWPSYDNLTVHGRRTEQIVAEKVAEIAREGGYDVASVVAYERENANRPKVIEALEALATEDEPEPLIAA